MRKFFALSVDSILKRAALSRIANRKSQKLIPIVNMIEIRDILTHLKVNGFTFKGSHSTLFSFDSLLN